MLENTSSCLPFLDETDKAIRRGLPLTEEPPSNKTGEPAACEKRKSLAHAGVEYAKHIE